MRPPSTTKECRTAAGHRDPQASSLEDLLPRPIAAEQQEHGEHGKRYMSLYQRTASGPI